jgi:hypothetical protein
MHQRAGIACDSKAALCASSVFTEIKVGLRYQLGEAKGDTLENYRV